MDGVVYAFEPEPYNYKILLKNIAINGFQNVIPVQKCIADKSGPCRLFLNDINRSGHSILKQHGKYEIVEAITLDEFFRDTNKVNLIKLDIEGAEPLALCGALKLIESNKNIIILTEFIPKAIERSGVKANEFLQKLFKQGFKLYNINESTMRLEPVNAPCVKYIRLQHGITNLLCLKNNHVQFDF